MPDRALSESQARAALQLLEDNDATQQQLAEHFGCSAPVLGAIRNGRGAYADIRGDRFPVPSLRGMSPFSRRPSSRPKPAPKKPRKRADLSEARVSHDPKAPCDRGDTLDEALCKIRKYLARKRKSGYIVHIARGSAVQFSGGSKLVFDEYGEWAWLKYRGKILSKHKL